MKTFVLNPDHFVDIRIFAVVGKTWAVFADNGYVEYHQIKGGYKTHKGAANYAIKFANKVAEMYHKEVTLKSWWRKLYRANKSDLLELDQIWIYPNDYQFVKGVE